MDTDRETLAQLERAIKRQNKEMERRRKAAIRGLKDALSVGDDDELVRTDFHDLSEYGLERLLAAVTRVRYKRDRET